VCGGERENKFQTSKEGLNSTSSQARQRRKLLGGHCECFEKQAFGFIIINIWEETQKQCPNFTDTIHGTQKEMLFIAQQVLKKSFFLQTLRSSAKFNVQNSNPETKINYPKRFCNNIRIVLH
jgi:hypothetical protein